MVTDLVLRVESVRHFLTGTKPMTEVSFTAVAPATGKPFILTIDYDVSYDGLLGASIVVPLTPHLRKDGL